MLSPHKLVRGLEDIDILLCSLDSFYDRVTKVCVMLLLVDRLTVSEEGDKLLLAR